MFSFSRSFYCFLLSNLFKKTQFLFPSLVVAQYYDTDVNKAYVIRGNAAVLKCEIPSFVADFVSVVSWHTDQNEDFMPGTEYGWCFKFLLE